MEVLGAFGSRLMLVCGQASPGAGAGVRLVLVFWLLSLSGWRRECSQAGERVGEILGPGLVGSPGVQGC